jgi:hypothetical protein
MVCGITAATSAVMGRPVTIELPKSPRTARPMKLAYCANSGWSVPSFACSAATASGVA